jgi:hypothetical protein
MGIPESPALTDVENILVKLENIDNALSLHTEAVNGLGANVQWIVDNVKDIFQMFHSPMFTAMMGQAMTGAMGNVPADQSGTDNSAGPANSGADVSTGA